MVQRHTAQGIRCFLIGKADISEEQRGTGRHCVYIPLAYRLQLQYIINLIHPHRQVPKLRAELYQFHQRADNSRPHDEKHEKVHHQMVISWI